MDVHKEIGWFTLGGTLGGSLLTGLLGLGASWINNRKQIELERIKIHESEITKAYQALFDFSISISNYLFPMCSEKEENFEYLMKKEFPKISSYRIYLSQKTNMILDVFLDIYECSRNPDLIEDTQEDVRDFVNEKAFPYAEELKKEIVKWQEKRGLL